MPRGPSAGQIFDGQIQDGSRPELVLRSEGNTPFTLLVEGPSRRLVRKLLLAQPCLRIGRSPRNDLCLNHPQIEPRHAAIFVLDGGLYVCALSPVADIAGSRGGVIADWWRPGVSLGIGPYRLRLEGGIDEPPSQDPRAIATQFDAELSRPVIQFPDAHPPYRICPLTRTLTLIGNSELCDWRLAADGILPVHAAIVRNPEGMSLIDLSGSEQTFLNDRPIGAAALDWGDVVRLSGVSGQLQSSATWESTAEVGSGANATARSTAEVDRLVRELKAQHLHMLEFHRNALEQIENLMSDPARNIEPLRAILKQSLASDAVPNRKNAARDE